MDDCNGTCLDLRCSYLVAYKQVLSRFHRPLTGKFIFVYDIDSYKIFQLGFDEQFPCHANYDAKKSLTYILSLFRKMPKLA